MNSQFVPLIDIWPAHGLASVTVALLEDASFHPLMDCDPRGWHHFRGWPLGAERPVTIYIPASEREEALAFMNAPAEVSSASPTLAASGFWAVTAANRTWMFGAWLFLLLFAAT